MKILTTYEAQNAFPKVLKLSQKDVVIVTNRGKPVAAIQGLKDEDDLEDYLLERSPKFWAMIRRARRGKRRSCAKPVGIRRRIFIEQYFPTERPAERSWKSLIEAYGAT